MQPFFVYLLRCADGSYYCGHTDNMDARMQQHVVALDGYLATRKPVELVWQGEFETRAGAIEFEQRVKGWSRAKKEALMAGNWDEIKRLARAGLHSGRKPVPAQANPFLAQLNPVLTEPNAALAQLNPVLGQPNPVLGQPNPLLAQPNPVRAELVEASSLLTSPSTSSGRTGEGADSTFSPRPRPSPAAVRAEPVEALFPTHADRILHADPLPQRRAIAKAITLLESTRADHRAQADALLTSLLPHTGRAFRLGISGVPGVGKSTFIEALGLYLIDRGHRVAVLTIDPSSTVSGGSILGDKTRMEMLSVHERAYIRPSPSSGTLGGVAEKTREAMLVCEAAGYDIVIVETVGVGQSETAVAGMTDMFVLLQLPNAGDELQAIKKGVMEIADLVVINKADIDPDAATRAQAQITSSLRLLGMHGGAGHAQFDENLWHPRAMQLSALRNEGVDRFWDKVEQFRSLQTANGRLDTRRQKQALAWMWERIEAGLKQAFRSHPQVRSELPAMVAAVTEGRIAASTAARALLAAQTTDTAPI